MACAAAAADETDAPALPVLGGQGLLCCGTVGMDAAPGMAETEYCAASRSAIA